MKSPYKTNYKIERSIEDWGTVIVISVAILSTVLVLTLGIVNAVVNNAAQTEKRAYENAKTFISTNEIEMKRMTCARDSDGDGYGACAITTTSTEKIYLECPTDWFTVSVLGATSCKEVDTTLKFSSAPRR